MRWTWVVVVAMGACGGLADDFETGAGAILAARCLECHNAGDRAGGLNLTDAAGLAAGGDSGVVVEPGRPEESELLRRVAEGEMPPRKAGKSRALPREEVERLTAWVHEGAAWPAGRVLDPFERSTETRGGRDLWSLQPIARPGVPAIRLGAGSNPIDAFLDERLSAQGWEPAPEADRRTLMRRVTFDLTGLPATGDEIEAFAADGRPDAYERLVDRLLASPHFGERWGRHWLDVARYADTCGYERDQEKPGAWRYRDWVIGALNADIPYDRFVIEQLAGDEIEGADESTVIATGFLRLGTWNDEPNDPQEYKYERLEDMVHATGTAFLGLTIKCARCHDHKFDPIRQTDYYRLAAAFWAGPIEPGERELLGGPDPTMLGYAGVLGWTDRGREVPPLNLLKKGDPARPGPVVEAGPPSLVPTLDVPFDAPPEGARTTWRRLQLARWITDPGNPLTARVWVNRIWSHHFGQGLVRSPDNFGFNGEPPTHPALLDWLASELIADGWRSKRLHRLMVTSAAYRRASIHPRQEEYAVSDASNRLWWRAERRRLDAESLRDALLAASGELDRARMGGPGFVPDVPAEALEGLSMKDGAWKASPEAEQRRRAVYLYAKRGLLPPLMTAFDFGDTTLPCGRRDVTLVAPQALALLNNAFVHGRSAALARRVAASAGDVEGRVRWAWRLALGREPTNSEKAASLEHLDRQTARLGPEEALASLCHVLINTNEFLFVD